MQNSRLFTPIRPAGTFPRKQRKEKYSTHLSASEEVLKQVQNDEGVRSFIERVKFVFKKYSKFMRKVFLLITIFIFSCGCHSEPVYSPRIDPNNFQATYLEGLILERVNEVRESYNAQPLEWENKLQQAAQSQADNMKDWNRVSHHQISLTKFSLSNRLKYFGIKNQAVGENLADIYLEIPMEVNFAKEPVIIREYKEAADALVLSWKYSPGHFKNLVDPKFKYTGIKVQINATNKTIYAAQVFGS